MEQAGAGVWAEYVAAGGEHAAAIQKLMQKVQLKANHQRAVRLGEATRDARIGRASPGAPAERGAGGGAQKGLVSPVHRPDHFTRGTCGGTQGISRLVPAGHEA